ncbi:hypothetical protein N0V82_005972 [Gnomoniopsis sp. IMI 355080]|nr:hypothetical protein N0V82_005972 [Gnomoniopsis sp. IMI 355080]
MAAKPPKIAQEEWDRHKELIKGLYVKNSLLEVIKEMEEAHGFSASKSQYEAKLRFWGIKKNLTRTEWETHLAGVDGQMAPHLVTSSGRVKDKKKIERAKRYLNQIRSTKDIVSTASAESAESESLPHVMEVQHNVISQPQAPILDNSLMMLGKSVDRHHSTFSPISQVSLSSFNHDSEQIPSGLSNMGGNASPSAANTTSGLASSTDEFSSNHTGGPGLNTTYWHPDSLPWGDLGSGEFSNTNVDEFEYAPFQHYLSPSILFRSRHGTPTETGDVLHSSFAAQSSSLLAGCNSSLNISREWLRNLPFVEFEGFLNSRDMALTSRSSTNPSLSGSLLLRSYINTLYGSDRTATRQADRLQSALRMLVALPRGTAGALISEDQITESKIMRLLLFSILNGFSGLNDIPIKDLLLCLRRLAFFNTSFLQSILEAPSHTSRTFIDNLFKAAVDAKDEQVIQILVSRDVVDVNNTICFLWNGERCTPVEKAANLKALRIVRILVENGADVSTSYSNNQYSWPLPHYEMPYERSALHFLLGTAHLPPPSRAEWLSSTDLINTIKLLISKGSKVSPIFLLKLYEYFDSNPLHEVLSLLSETISLADHKEFFVGSEKLCRWQKVPIIETAALIDTDASKTIMSNLVRTCQSHGGSCLAEVPEVIEEAAVQAALRGRLEVVELLIDYTKSTDLVLSAAIRSGNPHLIDYFMLRNPSLDPPARYLRPIDALRERNLIIPPKKDSRGIGTLTTPFAEAVRTWNEELARRLESEGCRSLASLKDHGRLQAAIFAAAEVGNIPVLNGLLQAASCTHVAFRVPEEAIIWALEFEQEEAAHLLIKENAKSGGSLDLALEKRYPKIMEAILATSSTSSRYSRTEAALRWGEPSVLKSLLFARPDMEMPSSRGTEGALEGFCLHCMRTENLDLFRLFVESTSEEKDLDSCLAMAIRESHRQMALYLLQMGANPSASRVLEATIPDRPEMFSLLFANGTDTPERQQARAPHKCVGANILCSLMSEYTQSGEAQALDQLLSMGAVNLVVPETIKDPKLCRLSLTPLGLAILGIPGRCNTNVVAIEKFLQAGADPNHTARLETYPYMCITALMAALETGRDDIVTLLIDKRADVNLKPHLSLRRTPLQYAVELDNLDMIQLLLRRGADVNSPPAFQGGGTALQFAAISGNCSIAVELLEQGARLDIPPSKLDGRWPLEGAAEHGRLDMIQLLWNARELSPQGVGFEKRQCLRAMDFAEENGYYGCRNLIAELSGLAVELLDTEDYGVPWLAY